MSCRFAWNIPVDKTDKKVTVWICKGCDIGTSLDVEALEKVATDECEVCLCRSHPFLCGDEGVELIKQEIQQGINALVVVGCSPRFNTDTFTFDGCLTDRVKTTCGWALPECKRRKSRSRLTLRSTRPFWWWVVGKAE
ncbi:MAG: hypothetical protein ACYTF1_20345 [Planctomycetota bacterium]